MSKRGGCISKASALNIDQHVHNLVRMQFSQWSKPFGRNEFSQEATQRQTVHRKRTTVLLDTPTTTCFSFALRSDAVVLNQCLLSPIEQKCIVFPSLLHLHGSPKQPPKTYKFNLFKHKAINNELMIGGRWKSNEPACGFPLKMGLIQGML